MRRLRTSGLQFLLALVLSIALWTFVSYSVNPTQEASFEVPVTITPPADGLETVAIDTLQPETPEAQVMVLVSGPQADLRELTTADFTATADLSELAAGTHTVPIEVTAPRVADVRSVEPDSLIVQIEPHATREVAVEAAPVGATPFLFTSNPPEIEVEQAIIDGPQPLIERVARVVVPVSLDGRTATFTEQSALVPVDVSGQEVAGVTVTPSTSNVEVVVRPDVSVQRVAVAPRIEGQPAPGFQFTADWNPKFMELIAPTTITQTLPTEPITLTGQTESFSQTVRLARLPSNYILQGSDLVTVTVNLAPLEFGPVTNSLFLFVSPLNLEGDQRATIEPAGVTINVQGAAADFNQLATTALQATVDVGGLGPGVYTLPVTVGLPPGLSVVGPQPTVAVTITAAPTPVPSTVPPDLSPSPSAPG